MNSVKSKSKSFRDLGDTYLRDAQNTSLSDRSRAELAFDATYMYAMSQLDEATHLLDHPHPDVLFEASRVLDIAPETMMPAMRHLNDRRRRPRHEGQLDELMALALQLKALVHQRE